MERVGGVRCQIRFGSFRDLAPSTSWGSVDLHFRDLIPSINAYCLKDNQRLYVYTQKIPQSACPNGQVVAKWMAWDVLCAA